MFLTTVCTNTKAVLHCQGKRQSLIWLEFPLFILIYYVLIIDFYVQLLLLMLVWLVRQKSLTVDSLMLMSVFYFKHIKRYVNLAKFDSTCASCTKYQQKTAFYYRLFFYHLEFRLI